MFLAPARAWFYNEDKNQDDGYREDHTNDTPASPEPQELKRKFEEVVGKEMLEYLYEPQYRLARTPFNLASSGLRSNGAFHKTGRLLREWEELRFKLSGAAPATDEGTVLTQQASIEEANGLMKRAWNDRDPSETEECRPRHTGQLR